jgi:hypothetical protein
MTYAAHNIRIYFPNVPDIARNLIFYIFYGIWMFAAPNYPRFNKKWISKK